MLLKFNTSSFALVCALLGVLSLVQPAMAQDQDKAKPVKETRKTPALRNKVYERLSEAQVLSEGNDFVKALEVLTELENLTGKRELNSYELANVYNLVAYIRYQQEDYQGSINAYKKLIKQPNIPLGMEVATRYSIAQMYFVVSDYDNAAKSLEAWFGVANNPGPDPHMLLAQAYLQLKQLDKSLLWAEKAIKVAKAQNRVAEENWYQVLRYLYSEKNRRADELKVLKNLVRNWPKKDYWMGLSGVYGELNQEDNQLFALHNAYMQGYLSNESELVALSQMLAAKGIPYAAAKVIERGMAEGKIEPKARNLERLGEYWRLAQETKKAIPVLEKAAAKSESGDPYLRLAYIHFALDDYKAAARAASKALSKSDFDKKEDAYLLLGQSHFYDNNFGDARKVFMKALALTDKKDVVSKKRIDQWLNFIESESKRQADIKAYINS